MIFRNKPDEDWYWQVKILYTLGFISHRLISRCSSSLCLDVSAFKYNVPKKIW